MTLLLRGLFVWCLGLAVARAGDPQEVLPLRVSEGALLLHGAWKFKYFPSTEAGTDEAFFQPSFDVGAWKEMPVPGHWELHGFAEPHYASEVQPGTGLYRRTFRTPAGWRGQRVFLRFDGVLYGYTVWVNGRQVGEWASSFNPATFDITEALQPGDRENVLAVRVTTRSKGWEFDTMDCWGLSGIFRDVTLFALAPVHLNDYTARTTLQPDGSAQVQLNIAASAAATARVRLFDPQGNLAQEVEVTLAADGKGETRLRVAQPQLWTAENPWLYRLELDLMAGGRTVQHFTDRIGLRQVTVDGGILKLNGVPIKLRGIDHHDIWPQEGRVATEELMRRDLELMRGANINFIRTSHYPPHPRFIELCDELGLYVDCEVPFIHGREHHTDPSYQAVLDTRARATVLRDKNRASIILWSIGNENHITELGLNTGKLVKQLDPTRPITYPTMGSYFATNYQDFPDFVDLYSPHYPSTKAVKNYAEKLSRPIVFTEYAHQRGLARDGAGVQDIWEAMYRAPRVAGGAAWLFQDQGILRTAPDIKRVENGDLMVWLDEHRYYDTHGYYGPDGIVFSDRTPQTDYWQVRKVYSPVQVPERSLSVRPGAQTLQLHVENRFDFRSLTSVRLEWSLHVNRTTPARGTIALKARPHTTETVALPLTLPKGSADVLALELRFLDETGSSIYERSLALESEGAPPRESVVKAMFTPSEPVLELSDAVVTVRHRNYTLKLDRKSGQLSLLDSAGATLISAIGPHTARKLTINELGKKREGEATHWSGELLREVARLSTDARQTPEGVVVRVAGMYPRPAAAKESVEGECQLLLTPQGTIDVSYRYTPAAATGTMVEAGLALAVPPALSEFRWIGQGPYAGYPGHDRLNEFGLFHQQRDDLYFPGNRRGVELAFMANPAGAGVMITGDQLTVSVEKREAETIFSHLSLASGQRSERRAAGENGENKSAVQTGSLPAISGHFTLLPLPRDWPEPLLTWFGPAATAARPFRPFLRVYDQ